MQNIDNILDKYFEGETSIEEEKALRKYFQSKTIADKHKPYQAIFGHLATENAMHQKKKTKRKPQKFALYYFVSACVAIFAIIFMYNLNQNSSIQSEVYVDGIKINDKNILRSEALKAIASINDNSEMLEAQIDILDDFLE